MRLFKIFLLAFAMLNSNILIAKDLNHRLGVGFINQFKNETGREMPGVSVKYGLSKELHWLVALGVNSASPTSFSIGTKLFKNIFYESNLNFYTAIGLAYIRESKSSFDILALLGAEIFIPGVDSLGLSFEAGASVANNTGSFAFRTVGYTFLNAGMHFYF